MKSKPTPRVKKSPGFNLKRSTCAQLHEWLSQPPAENERESDLALRRFYSLSGTMELLALCGPLKASYHRAWINTARHLRSVPHLQLFIGGGQPHPDSMPTFTASLKRIAAINGIVVHRFGKGAFIMDPVPKKPSQISLPEEPEKASSEELFPI